LLWQIFQSSRNTKSSFCSVYTQFCRIVVLTSCLFHYVCFLPTWSYFLLFPLSILTWYDLYQMLFWRNVIWRNVYWWVIFQRVVVSPDLLKTAKHTLRISSARIIVIPYWASSHLEFKLWRGEKSRKKSLQNFHFIQSHHFYVGRNCSMTHEVYLVSNSSTHNEQLLVRKCYVQFFYLQFVINIFLRNNIG
jgi:hypothetical protein